MLELEVRVALEEMLRRSFLPVPALPVEPEARAARPAVVAALSSPPAVLLTSQQL
jgi:hypothetical protein